MVFSSIEFLFFFLPAVLIVYFLPIKSVTYKNAILLLASLAFYAWGEPVFVFVMLFSITVNWLISLIIEKSASPSKRKMLLTVSIVWNVALIGIFKYAGFVADNINFLLKDDVFTVNIALPIGISFFTFQIMSYVIDVYRKTVTAQKNLFITALYISMFPPLIAGPIVRYSSIAEKLSQRSVSSGDIARGFSRFTVGLAKKVLIANYAGYIADKMFDFAATGGSISVAGAWLGALAYAIQIYHDFSGYSDMAIGLGIMFGFHFPENFNYPYIAKSVQDFWSRWHISLSTWFRDYVYIPLGGNRISPSRTLFNLFAVWVLTGFWHGADWTFILWGLYYFCLLAIERKTGIHKKLGYFDHLYMVLAFTLGWVCFRAESLSLALGYYSHMFGLSGAPLTDELFFMLIKNGAVPLLIGAVAAIPVIPFLKRKLPAKTADILGGIAVTVLFVISAMSCVQSSYNPFIYFNF